MAEDSRIGTGQPVLEQGDQFAQDGDSILLTAEARAAGRSALRPTAPIALFGISARSIERLEPSIERHAAKVPRVLTTGSLVTSGLLCLAAGALTACVAVLVLAGRYWSASLTALGLLATIVGLITVSMRMLTAYRQSDVSETLAEADARRRHLALGLLEFAEEVRAQFVDIEDPRYVEAVRAKEEELRATASYFTRGREVEEAFRLIVALWYYWFANDYGFGFRRCKETFDACSENRITRLYARAFMAGARMAIRVGRLEDAKRWAEASLRIAERGGYEEERLAARDALTLVAMERSDGSAAKQWLDSTVDASDPDTLSSRAAAMIVQGDFAGATKVLEYLRVEAPTELAKAWALSDLANIALAERRPEEAEARAREALDNAGGPHGDPQLRAWAQNHLGLAKALRGDFGEARRSLEQSLALLRQLGDKRGLARVVESFSVLAAKEGDATRAATLIAAASRLRGDDLRRNVVEEEIVGMIRKAIAESNRNRQELEVAERKGLKMTVDDMIAFLWRLRV